MAEPVIYLPTRLGLKRVVGGRDRLYPFLERGLVLDTAYWADDFQGDTLHGGYQSTANGVAAVAAAILAGQVNGQIRLTTGTDDDGRSDLSLGLHYQGQLNAVIAVRLALSAITTVKVEVGFTDVVSGTDAGAVNVKATPSFTANDFAGWVLDTDDNTDWEGLGVAATVAATTVEAAIQPVAATFETLIVALRDGNAKYIRLDANGLKTYESPWQTLAITATVSLTPWVFAQSRAASASRNIDIDYIYGWQRRTVS